MEEERINYTLEYYNRYASEFITATCKINFHTIQTRFQNKLTSSARILDFGCGSGRDTKYFLSQGYKVDAVDGSEAMCRLAEKYTGMKVKQMLFQELSAVNVYDGVWACSSILHLPYKELKTVLVKIFCALKENGVFYTSFKYGSFEGERNGRYFTDMTEEKMKKLLHETVGFHVEEQWISTDVRPGREDERWLNIILKKR